MQSIKAIFAVKPFMKISGFTIIKNAVINDYPVVEANKSVLPVVDEMIVSIGDCEDNTGELIRSIKHVSRYWNEDDDDFRNFLKTEDYFNFGDFDSLQKFNGTHPEVMLPRINRKNWHIELNMDKKTFSFKKRFLYWFEKKTGIRPFTFRNYKII